MTATKDKTVGDVVAAVTQGGSTGSDENVVAELPSTGGFAPTHVVLRCFHGAGCDRAQGEVVDASDWRAADILVDMRYLRTLGYEDPEPVSDGDRYFIDDDSLLAFMEANETEQED